MPPEPTKASNAGIITDDAGERQIPESKRADGSTRKAIKIRPGYRPPEDIEVYKNRTAAAFRDRTVKGGIPGAAGLNEEDTETSPSAQSNKNAKRREARKKAKASKEDEVYDGGQQPGPNVPEAEEGVPEVEKEKRVRNLKKKLKQAKDLESKKEGGETLLPEQIAKVIKINELIRELEALGFDTEGDPKVKDGTEGDALHGDGSNDI